MEDLNNPTYSEALAELEKILATLRSNDCDIDRLTELTSRAVALLNHCRARLTTTDEELRKILDSFNK